jgi:enoyl-CoA hydratase/carnithine racemase
VTDTKAAPWALDGTVDVDIRDGVATVTLNRPPGNGWTPALGERFFATLDNLAVDPQVRVLVVTGAGKDFCVGADGGSLDNVADNGSYTIKKDRPTYWKAMTMGKPVIAAVNGACFGVGMQLALMCDIRFASASTKFATAFVRRGLVAELGMTWLLPRMVGVGVANDLLLSGRLVRATEAAQLGIINRVVDDTDLLAAATAYATEMAQKCSPVAMAVVKRQTYVDLNSTLPESVSRGDAYMEAALASADFAEGVRSWREKRLPYFAPLDAQYALFDLPGGEEPGHG